MWFSIFVIISCKITIVIVSGFLISCWLGGRRGGHDSCVSFLVMILGFFDLLVSYWLRDRRSGGVLSVSFLVGVGASLLFPRTTMVFYFRISKLTLWTWCAVVSLSMMPYTKQGVVTVTVPRFS